MASVVKKITTNTVGLNKKVLKDFAKKNETADILIIAGELTSAPEEKMGQFGDPYQIYKGNFKALNLISKEEFKSQALIVPALAEMLVSEYAGMLSDDNSRVEFAIRLGVEFYDQDGDDSGPGYKFTAAPLIENKVPSALDELLAKAQKQLK